MAPTLTPLEAYRLAHAHATSGLETYPHDRIYIHILEQLSLLDFTDHDTISPRRAAGAGFDLGLMATKELGAEERDFAHALHVLQRLVESEL